MHTPHHRSGFRLARAVWGRRKWLAMLAFCAPFSAAVSLVMGMPDLYRASATVLVKQDQVLETMARSAATGELEPRLQTISQEILSRSRLQDLITRFDLYAKLRQRAVPEEVIERMRKDIRLERKDVDQRWARSVTVAFTLSYQGWDPQTVAQVVNTLAAFYVEENEKLRQHQAAGVQTVGTVDVLAQLKRELAELRTRFSDKYPDVMRVKAEIAVLERERAEAARARAAVARAGAQATEASPPGAGTVNLHAMQELLETLKKKEQRLQETIAAVPQRGDNALKREQELERLRQDHVTTQEQHAALLKRYEAARRAETSARQAADSGEQFRILDPALAPSLPIAPSRLRLILMALILSLGMAGVVVLLAEQLDTSFHWLDELWAHTNLPILASVPRIVTRADTWRGGLRFGVLSILAAVGLALLVQGAYALGQDSEQLVWMLAQRGN